MKEAGGGAQNLDALEFALIPLDTLQRHTFVSSTFLRLININMVHIFLKEPKFPSLVPQAIFDDVTKIRKFGPFRSFSGLRQNFFGILVKFPIRKHTFLLLR